MFTFKSKEVEKRRIEDYWVQQGTSGLSMSLHCIVLCNIHYWFPPTVFYITIISLVGLSLKSIFFSFRWREVQLRYFPSRLSTLLSLSEFQWNNKYSLSCLVDLKPPPTESLFNRLLKHLLHPVLLSLKVLPHDTGRKEDGGDDL